MFEWLGYRTLFFGSPEFNSSAALVNSQLVCLLCVEFLTMLFSIQIIGL